MTEKIRLKDGTEFELIPMGIKDKDKLRFFKIISELPQAEIIAKFNEINIEKIEHALADDSIGTTYEDCTVFKFITFVPNVQIDDNTVSGIYIVVVSTDAVEKEFKATQQYIDNAIGELTLLIAMMGGIL